ncbi:hypothetical protein, partial [Mucilaginibacter sp.]|uniref:hypothetical protein n=1 Tax=Mucilaginibacter sp. TaxID=1882438 RepID=UPI00374C9F3F
MYNKFRLYLTVFSLFFVPGSSSFAQELLSMKDAVKIGLENYPVIKSKANQLNASKAYLSETR